MPRNISSYFIFNDAHLILFLALLSEFLFPSPEQSNISSSSSFFFVFSFLTLKFRETGVFGSSFFLLFSAAVLDEEVVNSVDGVGFGNDGELEGVAGLDTFLK